MKTLTNVTVFQFEAEQVRTFVCDGEPWFVGVDVCRVLGLTDARKSLGKLDEEDRNTVPVLDARSVEQATIIISEPGLYSLIMRSRRPEAKRFRKWVTSVVLPSIRRTGQYAVAAVDPIAETHRLAAAINIALPAITDGIKVLDGRVADVETWQREHNPQEKQRLMMSLHRLRDALVKKTKGTAQPVTHPGFWRALHAHCGISSFQDKSALTVTMLRQAEEFAFRWADDRRANGPELFERAAAEATDDGAAA